MERLVVVAAHPDDEAIGASMPLSWASRAWVVHVTDGAPRDPSLRSAPLDRPSYAALRRREAERSLSLVGVSPGDIVSLGAVDQEAALELAPLARRLASLLERLRPDVVITHPYEGGHPDHDAAAFATRAACAWLARRSAPPLLVEMTSYHRRGGELVTGEFLPEPLPSGDGAGFSVELTGEARSRKRAMLDAHESQRTVLEPFGDRRERFRLAPRCGFRSPPHPGVLHYEAMGWAMSGERFCMLASAALDELGLEG